EPRRSNKPGYKEKKADLNRILQSIAADCETILQKLTPTSSGIRKNEKKEKQVEEKFSTAYPQYTELGHSDEIYKPIGLKLTKIKEVPNIGCSPQNEIENKASEWNLKSEEDKSKKMIRTHEKERPKKEKSLCLTDQKEPKDAYCPTLNMDIRNKTSKPKNKTFKPNMLQIYPKEKKKIGLEMCNYNRNTNKIIEKKTSRCLLAQRSNLQIFDSGGVICSTVLL
ncbi:22431_t:CDS:2, partial [Gigaspora rosea]